MPNEEATPRPRLDSWKSIAAHLGRSVRTVQRWEAEEGLPVQRLAHEQRGSVYAHVDELDAWWQSKSVRLISGSSDDVPMVAALTPPALRSRWRIPLWAGAAALAFMLAGAFSSIRTAHTRDASISSHTPVPLTSYPQSETYPSFAPDGKRFAFAWNPIPGNNDIFSKSVDGGEPQRLTTHPQFDFNPAWSPDGRHIAFLRSITSDAAELLIIPSEGGLERSLGQFQAMARSNLKVPPPNMAWTPDNHYLIVSAQEGLEGPLRLLRVAVADGARIPVLKAEAGILGDAGPSISPDGKRLAFHRFAAMGNGEIRVATLTPQYLGAEAALILKNGKYNANPVWINNTELVYNGYRQGEMQLFRISADTPGTPIPVIGGTQATQIAYSATAQRLAFKQERSNGVLLRLALRVPGVADGEAIELIRSSRQDVVPEYSPDGAFIAFTSSRAGYPNIWICDREGGHCRQVTYLEGSITGPTSWSPDGKRLTFASNTTGVGDIYTQNVSGTGAPPRNLTSDAADDIRPSWSRDGNWIYFGSNRSGRYEVWKVSPEGGPPIQVTSAGGSMPVESLDGKWLYYTGDNQYDTSLWRRPTAGGASEKVVERMNYFYTVGRSGVYYASVKKREVRYWNAAKREDLFLFETKTFLALGLGVSPDERELCISVFQGSGSDIMMIAPYR